MIVVFCGPTVSPGDVEKVLPAKCLPPAARGDVYRVALTRPNAIVLIDGYFDAVPSVWHKEFLWAMAQGIHVFGAASMGALRAAELADFGMVGVGKVFQAFACGDLSRDDEVAVAHASAEEGYRGLSDALVNLRFTFRAAARAQVISTRTCEQLEGIAQQLFYPERSHRAVLLRSQRAGVDAGELTRLRDWLPGGFVNQKREDALDALRLVDELQGKGWRQKTVDYQFSHTDAWETLTASVTPGNGHLRDVSVSVGGCAAEGCAE